MIEGAGFRGNVFGATGRLTLASRGHLRLLSAVVQRKLKFCVVQLTRKQRLSLVVFALCSLGAATAFSVAPPSLDADAPAPATIVEALPVDAPVIGATDSAIFHRQERIQRGDTLALVLQRLGAQDPAFLAFARQDKAARQLLQLRPGRSVSAELDRAGRIRRFSALVETSSRDARASANDEDEDAADDSRSLRGATRLSAARRVLITRTAGDESAGKGSSDRLFVARDEAVRIERSLEMRGFEIRTSLFSATDEAGIPDPVATQVAEILGGDLDFHRDLRRGDSVRVVWESLRVADGLEGAVAGRVLAVEMVHQNRKFQAIWFDRGNGRGDYYTGQGRSMRKAFLRSPLEFSRVSSGFSTSRLHPIHQDWRAHRGVDYSAPSGTRVRAVADGVVESMGRKNGYGNVLAIQHPNRTTSLYAHLSGFGPNLRPGSRISQGDLVGFVGATGWATGPHLHYEFIVDGTHVDPLKVALPNAVGISAGEMAPFRSQADGYLRRIALLSTPRLARFE